MTNLANQYDKEADQERWVRQFSKDFAEFVKGVENFEAEVYRLPDAVRDEEELTKFGDMVIAMRPLHKRLEENRQAEKAPVLIHAGAIDQFFGGLKQRLEALKASIEKRQQAFSAEKAKRERERREEEQRKAKEEADRLEREAAEKRRLAEEAASEERRKLAAAELEQAEARAAEAANQAALATKAATVKPADLVRTRSKTGASLYTEQEYWTFEVEDIGIVPLGKLRDHFERKHIESAIRDFVQKGGRELPGVRVFSATRPVNR